jgi:hypothetical protein
VLELKTLNVGKLNACSLTEFYELNKANFYEAQTQDEKVCDLAACCKRTTPTTVAYAVLEINNVMRDAGWDFYCAWRKSKLRSGTFARCDV